MTPPGGRGLVRWPAPAPRVRLLCVPHAGAGAALFVSWPSRLPAWIEVVGVRLPGRESRRREPPLTSLDAMADDVLERLGELGDDLPVAVYGHCSGALAALRITERLVRLGCRPVPRLFVSSAPSPSRPGIGEPVHLLSRSHLIRYLDDAGAGRFGDADVDEVFRLTEPAIRADFQAFETAVPLPVSALPVPITVFRARHDRVVSEASSHDWAGRTSRGVTRRVLPGRHFLLDTATADVLAGIRVDLTDDLTDDLADGAW
ncbi:thioesterase II family protein [Virgisporangium aurantiacum]|uniref:Thioesterase n=1 Tax=Virgisporangium aurantiacum TaxID=175570 RepID=A0A8J4E5F7_9ACTN|nr:thioesterase [Virgisporangium aurantiacum]GIJ62246.1 thioesterase [Virgisporangium aurantiacum]